jgi:hypothetical protein
MSTPFNYPIESWVDKDRAMSVVNTPLEKSWIKQRTGAGGMKLDYVEGGRVKKILIEAFENKYSWEILKAEIIQSNPRSYRGGEPQQQPPYVFVWGRLTVPGLGSRDGFGSKVIQFSENAEQQSQAFKSAATDAFKVAASYFGVALELYIEEEEVAEPPKEEVARQYQSAPTVAPPKPHPTWDASDVEKLKNLKTLMNITDNKDLEPFIKDWSGGTLTSFTEISPENIRSFNEYLEKKYQK